MTFVTTDGAINRRVTPSANMDWLGDPPTNDRLNRYDAVRVSRHITTLLEQKISLRREETELMQMFCESDAQRSRRNARLSEVQSQLSHVCQCEICRKLNQ